MVDSNLEIPENAEKYYNKGKKAKRKIKGVNIAIERTKKDVEKMRNKRELAMEKVRVPQKRVRRQLKWFEKLRWFLSSDGLLVVGGRDAGTNELVVKRYLDNQDIYLHSDIHGALLWLSRRVRMKFLKKAFKKQVTWLHPFPVPGVKVTVLRMFTGFTGPGFQNPPVR
jgi:predicted ribosome quality control (RQC) complex YloA/Tae2 family protein